MSQPQNQSSSSDVRLRRLRGSADGELTFRWRNTPAIYKWCRQADVLHPEPHKRWYEKQQDDPTMSMYMIDNGDNESVGVCGLTSIDHINSRAEFSLYIDPEFHHKGYGRAALKALLAKAFDVLNLNLVWGEAFDGNPAMRMFERVGFKQDGVRRNFYYREGRYIDAVLFSITKDEYGARDIKHVVVHGDHSPPGGDMPTAKEGGSSGSFDWGQYYSIEDVRRPNAEPVRKKQRQEKPEGE